MTCSVEELRVDRLQLGVLESGPNYGFPLRFDAPLGMHNTYISLSQIERRSIVFCLYLYNFSFSF